MPGAFSISDFCGKQKVLGSSNFLLYTASSQISPVLVKVNDFNLEAQADH
jgi:hypothetical protein